MGQQHLYIQSDIDMARAVATRLGNIVNQYNREPFYWKYCNASRPSTINNQYNTIWRLCIDCIDCEGV